MQQVQIMVVEDEKIVAADIRQNLTMLGYMVPAVLASGEEAIKKAAEQCPDLVLMDIQLKAELTALRPRKLFNRGSMCPSFLSLPLRTKQLFNALKAPSRTVILLNLSAKRSCKAP